MHLVWSRFIRTKIMWQTICWNEYWIFSYLSLLSSHNHYSRWSHSGPSPSVSLFAYAQEYILSMQQRNDISRWVALILVSVIKSFPFAEEDIVAKNEDWAIRRAETFALLIQLIALLLYGNIIHYTLLTKKVVTHRDMCLFVIISISSVCEV